MTYEEYIEDERQNAHDPELIHEYVDGERQRITRSADHKELAREVYTRLRRALPLKEYWLHDHPSRVFSVDSGRATYADIVVVRGAPEAPAGDPDAIANPSVIVEVIDETKEVAARGYKWDIYRRLATLREYALVSLHDPVIEVLSREALDTPIWKRDVYAAGRRIELASLELSIDVSPRLAVYRWFRG